MASKTHHLSDSDTHSTSGVKVPREAQALIGNTRFRTALGARDLDEANERKSLHQGVLDPLFASAYSSAGYGWTLRERLRSQ